MCFPMFYIPLALLGIKLDEISVHWGVPGVAPLGHGAGRAAGGRALRGFGVGQGERQFH